MGRKEEELEEELEDELSDELKEEWKGGVGWRSRMSRRAEELHNGINMHISCT